MQKASATQIIEIRNALLQSIPAIRHTGNRELMHETVIRIRQMEGILQARARRT